ncbi:hypothetical protein BH11BAC6_BH11BAC6_08050 [soil metagenome]
MRVFLFVLRAIVFYGGFVVSLTCTGDFLSAFPTVQNKAQIDVLAYVRHFMSQTAR